MQYENVFKVIGCSCYTCLPRTAQTARKTVAPGTGTGAPQMDQRLLANTWPKTIHNINIHANNSKNQETIHQYIKTANNTMLELFYLLQRSRGHKER